MQIISPGATGLSVPVAELHGLGGSRSLVQQGGVGHRHASEVTDHGLVIKERLQATLRDLGLVGGVLSHPEDKKGDADQTKAHVRTPAEKTEPEMVFKEPRRNSGALRFIRSHESQGFPLGDSKHH